MTLLFTKTPMAITAFLLLSLVVPSQALHNTSSASFRYPGPSSAPPSASPAVESSPRSNVYPQTRIKASGVESALLESRHLHKGLFSSSPSSPAPPSVPPAVESRPRVVTDRHSGSHISPSPSSGVPGLEGATHTHKSTDPSTSSSQMPPKSPPSPPSAPSSAVSRHKRTLYLPLVDNVTYDLAVKTGFAILLLTLVVSAWYLQHYYPHYYDYYDYHDDYHHDYPSTYERNWIRPDTLPVLRRLLQALRHYQYKYHAASALSH